MGRKGVSNRKPKQTKAKSTQVSKDSTEHSTGPEESMMAISFHPLGNRVVIEPIEQEDITSGGIVLPETAKEKPQKGKVLSAGPGDRDEHGKRIPMDINTGDTVLFARYSGTEIKVDGKKLLIIRENDLLAIVE